MTRVYNNRINCILKLTKINQHFVGNKAKGRISKRVFHENKAHQIFQKMNISYPLIRARTCDHQGGKKCYFFRTFDVLCFLETPALRFTLSPYYRRFKETMSVKR